MQKIDKAILATDQVICDNISKFNSSDRGLLSQNILSQIRNFVEYVAIKAFSNGSDINPNNYDINVQALKKMKMRGDLRFLYEFHELLQKSVSHYTVDRDGSERLMLKYYEHLLEIKTFLKDTYNMDVLENIRDFPLNTDEELSDYYKKIAERIETPNLYRASNSYNDRYYIQKIKPFFMNEKIYYEVTFTAANNKASKFDRAIAFTKHKIFDNYAVRLSIHNDIINILDRDMEIQIIDEWSVSIRQCEWGNFSKIFGNRISINTSSYEYRDLMKFLTKMRMSLSEYVESNQDYYDYIKAMVTKSARTIKIYDILDNCRKILIMDKPGANIIRYLLYKMNNRVIKWQLWREQCGELSNLYLSYGCIPFDKMPYCTSLRNHNPRLFDLFASIPTKGREHELFARFIKNNTEIEGNLFTLEKDLEDFDNIADLVKKYNSRLYLPKHEYRRLMIRNGYVYIKGYVEDSAEIIKRLQTMSTNGVSQYTKSVESWMEKEAYVIDDEVKKVALYQMFANSRVALIYGSAGTGKSTLIKHISSFWADNEKLYLANTHPAVDNMRRRVGTGNGKYYTIASFLSNKTTDINYDVLFIDECSTVSNDDMRQVLDKAKFKLLVLVGDVYQIESIYFGNWFSIAKKFMPETSIFELTHPYRTENEDLLTVWERVRNMDKAILEPLVKNEYTLRLDETIFEHTIGDEIILCLNYDGLYGINNVNRFLQSSNPNRGVFWGINVYKVGDPILFNESNRFSPLIYNNSKGRIVGIHTEEQKIYFDIELDMAINEIDVEGYDFELIGVAESEHSVISFSVNKFRSTDEDDDDDSTVVPFQVAYAVSIHKAQGLEYDSVKIIITNEVEERITHNIFYTAITRTKNKLKIYWSPETEKEVLERLEVKDSNKDAYLLAKFESLNMQN